MTDRYTIERYTGAAAAEYDQRRVESERSKVETREFGRLFEMVAPSSVLDCPFGTGRWLDWYRGLRGAVIGIDISTDMLAVAKAKLGNNPPSTLLLEAGDILSMDLEIYRAISIDLVVSTRFLNWLSFEQASHVFSRFATLRPRHMIVGVTVDSVARSRQVGQATSFVHEESAVLELFARHGYRVVEQVPIVQKSTRQHYFYLLSSSLATPKTFMSRARLPETFPYSGLYSEPL